MITVFTPTYNRADTLPRLYESLCTQTNKNFEWIVVDDGSTDNTKKLIDKFIHENKIIIRYFSQNNGGKHRAINRGVKEADGELFFIVDSDDYLVKDTIETIQQEYSNIQGKNKFAGLCGLKIYKDGSKVGGEELWNRIDCSSLDLRYKYKVKGDMAEVIRTDVFKEFPFPEIDGEKFCPEALVWNRIAQKYIIRHIYKKLYICEYRPDGLTASIVKVRRDSPQSSVLYYSELSKMPISVLQKLKAAVNFWRFRVDGHSCARPNFMLSVLGWLPGKLMRVRDNKIR